MKHAFLLIPALLLSACAATGGGAPSDPPDNSFIRGTARVLSINQTLGTARLEYNGQQIDAYWQTESTRAQLTGAVIRPDPLRPPIAHYGEAETTARTFPAHPGDTIRFLALRTGNTLFLQAIALTP